MQSLCLFVGVFALLGVEVNSNHYPVQQQGQLAVGVSALHYPSQNRIHHHQAYSSASPQYLYNGGFTSTSSSYFTRGRAPSFKVFGDTYQQTSEISQPQVQQTYQQPQQQTYFQNPYSNFNTISQGSIQSVSNSQSHLVQQPEIVPSPTIAPNYHTQPQTVNQPTIRKVTYLSSIATVNPVKKVNRGNKNSQSQSVSFGPSYNYDPQPTIQQNYQQQIAPTTPTLPQSQSQIGQQPSSGQFVGRSVSGLSSSVPSVGHQRLVLRPNGGVAFYNQLGQFTGTNSQVSSALSSNSIVEPQPLTTPLVKQTETASEITNQSPAQNFQPIIFPQSYQNGFQPNSFNPSSQIQPYSGQFGSQPQPQAPFQHGQFGPQGPFPPGPEPENGFNPNFQLPFPEPPYESEFLNAPPLDQMDEVELEAYRAKLKAISSRRRNGQEVSRPLPLISQRAQTADQSLPTPQNSASPKKLEDCAYNTVGEDCVEIR